jgi:hypothetical protein
MNPAPGTSWPDLHYVDTEQVELDVCAIIARGTRLRRRRLVAKVAAAAVVAAIAPVAVAVDVGGSGPVPRAPIAGQARHTVGQRDANPPGTGTTFGGEENGPMEAAPKTADRASSYRMFSIARAVVRHATALPRGYGRPLAVASARAGSGLWLTATARRLRLFRLSTAGALRSWALPTPARSVRASSGVGLAVSATGVAWIGVGSTLVSFDTKTSHLSTWRLPAVARSSGADRSKTDRSRADSVAVSQDGYVAVATSHSSAVSVLDPRDGTFQQIELPSAADQPLAVGFARNGTLGIGYERLGKPHSAAVLLVERAGTERSVPVPEPTAVAAYGASGLLVGVTRLYVVHVRGDPRPLILPDDSPGLAGVATPPAPLPGDRIAIATDTSILTFPATTTSHAIATGQSTLWLTPQPRCRPRHRCPAGYQLLASDADGDLWVAPKADPRTIELVNVR